MLSTVLIYLQSTVVVGAICLVVGVIFSTKIKDWIAGVPKELRSALSGVEQKAKQDIAGATAEILAKLPAPISLKAPVPVVEPAPPQAV